MTLFSVLTVTKDNIRGLGLTMESLRSQSFRDWEWVVVDGASVDGSQELLQSSGLPLTVLSEPDSGIYDAMNKATRIASGAYVVYLNAGDQLAQPDTLETVAEVAGQSGSAKPSLIFGGALFVTSLGQSYYYRQPRECFSYISRGLPAIHQATFFLLADLPSDPYDISYRICGDYALVAGLLLSNPHVAYARHPVAMFETSGVSSRHPFALWSESMRVRREILHLSLACNIVLTGRTAVRWVLSRIVARTIPRDRESPS